MATAMVPFTGRDIERRLLATAVERVRAGKSAVVVLIGQAGAGKSRLLGEASINGVRRLDVVGYEPESGIPFAAMAQVMGNLVADPSLTTLLATDVGGPAEPLRVFEAAFSALTSAGPTIVVVDDLQWLDASSSALLHYLVRGALAAGLPFGLLAATRPVPEGAPRVEALERLFGDRDGLVVHQLRPLSEIESVALVQAAVPATSDAVAARLWQRVGGSPYWLLALARATSDDPRSVLRERLDRLSVDAATVLGTLAVAGRPIDRSMARRLVRWPAERLDAAVRELVRTALVVEGAEGLRPAHDLVREAVVAELPEAARIIHHTRLAEVQEARAGGDIQQLGIALGHRIAAGRPAVDLALRLASSPNRRLLGSSGLDALDRVSENADPAQPGLPQLRVDVARLASELGSSPIAFERWRSLANDGPPGVRAEARLAAAREAYRLGRPTDVHDLLAGMEATDVDPVTALEVAALEASSLLWLESRFAAGRALAADVLARARELTSRLTDSVGDDDRRRVREAHRAALEVAFDAAMQAEEWQEQQVLAAELVDVSVGLGGRAHVEALLYDGMSRRYQGDREAAADRYRRAHALATRERLPDQIVEAGTLLASVLEALGRLDEAMDVGRATRELAERVGDFSKLRARPRTLLSEIRLSLGPWREALAAIEADAADLDAHHRLTLWQMAASAISRIQGRPAVARIGRLVEASLADAEQAGCPRCRREAQLVNAVSLARVGRDAQARQLLEAASATATAAALEPYVADMRIWALALLADADDGGVDGLTQVIERCRQTGRRIDAIWATIDLGRVLTQVDPARAAVILRGAGAEAVSIRAMTQASVADRLLRGLGQRTWRRGRAGDGPLELTEREREVAELVAGGASNSEIGDRLFVSIKTVERHVSNLFAKFGVRNRTELARSWSADGNDGREV